MADPLARRVDWLLAMRSIRLLVLTVLVIGGAASFLAAGLSARELGARSGALARNHLWQAPSLYPPPPAPIARLEPVEPELAPAPGPEARPDPAPAPPRIKLVKRSRPVVVEKPAAPVAPTEVEPEDAIRMALRRKRAAFEHCYETELRKQAAFSGFVLVALSLSSNGRVTAARVQEGNRRDAVVGACIVAKLRDLVLPALTSDADLLIPIRLEAKEQS